MIEVWAPDGVGEVRAGDDLAGLLLDAVAGDGRALRDGDVVLVTSKVVSKAEGRLRPGDRAASLAEETDRVVAARDRATIVRTRLGPTMAAAGIDASNVEPGWHLLLPVDPDASARALRRRVAEATDRNVAVVVTDTAGRAWRHGQTDIALGAAGLRVLDDHGGRTDAYGNLLVVTAPAVADEIASAAELAQGKLGARPFAVVRGRADLVLPPDDDGPGAAALVREPEQDLFGYGARDAVVAALAREPGSQVGFGAPATPGEVADAVRRALRAPAAPGRSQVSVDDEGVRVAWVGAAEDQVRREGWVLDLLAWVLGWEATPAADGVVLVPRKPG